MVWMNCIVLYELYSPYAAENTSNPLIVVRACDTDIFNLLLHFAPRLDAQIWMDTEWQQFLKPQKKY